MSFFKKYYNINGKIVVIGAKAVYSNLLFPPALSISATYHSLGLDPYGKVWGWGYNYHGQLGHNDQNDQCTPVSICGSNKTFCSIDTGDGFSLGIDKYGMVWGWGLSTDGQLGINIEAATCTPVSIYGSNTFCKISAGNIFSLGIDKYGKIWGWGNNDYGELGTNDIVNQYTPVSICGYNKTFCKITTGNFYSLGIDKYDQIWSWGYNNRGQLGNNDTSPQCTPVSILKYENLFFKYVAAGEGFSLGLDIFGRVWSWGLNNKGQLGNTNTNQQWIPDTIYDSGYPNNYKTFCEIVTGNIHSMGIDNYGKVWTWGSNNNAQLGNNDPGVDQCTPVSICGDNKTFCKISGGNTFSLAIDIYDKIWGWGHNYYGQLGNNDIINQYTPVSVYGSHIFCKISAGDYASLGLDNFGRIWGWGYNSHGQLGNNDIVPQSTPVLIYGNKTFCHISSGNYHSFGIDNHGHAWGWGYNSCGQLGNYDTIDYCTPVSICGNHTFCHIHSGDYYSIGIDIHGKAWGWGYYSGGALGSNSNSNIDQCTPVAVYGNKNFCLVMTAEHSLGIENNGVVWGWGYNSHGQLGNDDNTNKCTPVSIFASNIASFCSISAGDSHTLGLDKYGIIWGWGYNGDYGLLGNNSNTDQCTPVSICGSNKTFCNISAGSSHSLGIDKHGKVWGWGNNYVGQLGNNSDIYQCTPVSIYGHHTFCSIAAGDGYSLAIDNHNVVWCWGYYGGGVLGSNNSNYIQWTPVKVFQCKNKVLISAGYNHSLAIRNDIFRNGVTWGWGNNYSGQLGDNNAGTNQCTPVSIYLNYNNIIHNFCKISAGYQYSLAINNFGVIWGWGYNLQGQLGNNETTSQNTPVSILKYDKRIDLLTETYSIDKIFCSIEAGGGFSLGLDKYGKVWGWGYDNDGQLGNNENGFGNNKLTPVSICGYNKTFCKISAGSYHSLGIDKYGKVWGWGSNYDGQLGNNSNTNEYTPVSICNYQSFCSIYAGHNFSLGLDNYGMVWSWGDKYDGELGNNDDFNCQSVPVQVCGNHTFCKIDTGRHFSLGIDYKGQVWGWGSNDYGQLGSNNIVYYCTPVSITYDMPDNHNRTFCSISAGEFHSLGIDNHNMVWSWGYNWAGQLGDNTLIDRCTPVLIYGNRTFCSISAGYDYSLAIDNHNIVWGWGYYGGGRLGSNNNTTNQCTPVTIYGNKKFCKISTSDHSLGIDNRGIAWGWGYNYGGQLGINNTTDQCTPVSVLAFNTNVFCSISAGKQYWEGGNHSLALDKYGMTWCWGENNKGQLGNNSSTNECTPVSICGGNKTFCQISSGGFHSLGIDNHGKAWGWGYNFQAQLGNNSNSDEWTPVSIFGNHTYYSISAGQFHSLGIDKYGKVWGWGYNYFGQLGINDWGGCENIPVPICGCNKTFCKISAGGMYSLGIDKYGKVWGWGYNYFGQLGNNDIMSQITPVSVYGNHTFCSIFAGINHSLGVDNHNNVWGWGYNDSGELGDYSITFRCTPVMISVK